MARGERGVAAQRDLDRRGEPAQFVIGLAAGGGHDEGGLGEVVLGRDRLQRRIVEPRVERHHRRRIAGERAVGEGIDLDEAIVGHG